MRKCFFSYVLPQDFWRTNVTNSLFSNFDSTQGRCYSLVDKLTVISTKVENCLMTVRQDRAKPQINEIDRSAFLVLQSYTLETICIVQRQSFTVTATPCDATGMIVYGSTQWQYVCALWHCARICCSRPILDLISCSG